MAIQQYYNKGEVTQLCSYSQLSDALSSDWVWTGRTLSCFRDENGNDIPLDDDHRKDTFIAERSYVSAIWTMDMSPDPVKIYLIGDSGSVSVTVTEYNRFYPLGDIDNRYVYIHPTIISNNVENRVYVYQQGDSGSNCWLNEEEASYVRLHINKSDHTTISRISWGNEDIAVDTRDIITAPDCQQGSTNWFAPWYNYISNPWETTARKIKDYGLSVYFTSQGILEFLTNKNYVNPDLRQ